MNAAVRCVITCIASAISLSTPAAANAPQRAFTPRDLVMLDRISAPQVSPDGTRVLYGMRVTNLAENRRSATLWVIPTTGDPHPVRILGAIKGPTDARWSPDGKFVYFISPQSGSDQIWRADADGHDPVQITQLPMDVETFKIAADDRHVVFGVAVFPDCATLACTARRTSLREKQKASGVLYDRLFIRHWDTWADGKKNHLFALRLSPSGTISGEPMALMPAFDGDVPTKPDGGEDDFAIAPNGKTVVFSARLAGHSEPWSTNFDLWQVPVDGSSAPRNLTAQNMAWDGTPAFSPDGMRLAYLAQKRAGFESDRFAIMIRDLRTGRTIELDPSWDRSADSLHWSRDEQFIFTSADDAGDHRLFAVNAKSGEVRALTGAGGIEGISVSPSQVIYSLSTLQSPAQLFAMDLDGRNAHQLTHADTRNLSGIALSSPQRFSFAGWNGEAVYGRVMVPFGYRSGHKYPVAFLIHGGPQGAWLDAWSYRWNPQTYAGQGYAVVTIDFHGSTGYGQAFTDSISQHWGDRPLEDLQKGWAAALAQFAFLNGDRACALGASYGGYMIDWIAGKWRAPWKCLVVHDGIFDTRMEAYSTEELWFSEWENGGTPWDHPVNYEQYNPVDHVADWSVPMLVVHSSNDFRIPIEQGIGAFTALQRRGIPSEFLTFPDENHFVSKPQNSLQWHDAVDAWLARWLK